MRPFLPLVALSSFAQVTQALYFFLDGTTQKCFYEELPKDTLVVGHYTAEEYDENRHAWWKHDGISIFITVDVRWSPLILSRGFLQSGMLIRRKQELFDNNHRIVTQKGGSGGRFTFTAHEAGDHKICFTPSSDSGKTGWLSTSNPNGGIKLTLDMTIGETSVIESSDKDKLMDIQSRVKDLNSRLQDIRREQVFQRVHYEASTMCEMCSS